MHRPAAGLLIVALVWQHGLPGARAGNDDEILLGNQAAMTGGAVTATVSDGGALSYNPAGLAAVDENKVDVSASAFTVRAIHLDGAIRSTSGETADLSFAELVTVPSTLSFIRPLTDDVRLGFGIFVRRAGDFTARQTLDVAEVDGTAEWIGLLSAASSSYVGIVATAWQPVPELRLGVSAQLLFESTSGTSQLAGGVRMPGGLNSRLFISASELFSRQSFGVRWSAGAQWEHRSGLHLGATLHTPSWVFLSTARRAVLITGLAQSGAEVAPGFYGPSDTTVTTTGFEPLDPFAVRVGAAWVGERGQVAADVDVRAAVDDRELGVDRGRITNARVGGVLRVAPSVELGLGLFTDLNPHRRLSFGQLGLDFYGATLGVQYANDYAVTDQEDGDRLTFSTHLAIRYAYGTGRAGALLVRPTTGALPDDGGDAIALADASVHEITVHVGSGFRF